MKTTIDFPDDLLHRAKIAAVQRKTTLKEIVLQGVDYVITHSVPTPAPEAERASTLIAALSRGRNKIYAASAEHEEKERKATLKRLLEAMKASNTEPMVPLKREEIYDR